MLIELLRHQGPQVLNTQTIPQFGKIFVMILVLDNLQADGTQKWPTIFADLVGLVQVSEDFEVQKLFMRFIIKTLLIFDEEVVERSTDKPAQWTVLSQKIKDFVRDGKITEIVNVIIVVINNHSQFETGTVKDALIVLAQLIDWNELQYFTEIIPLCKQMIENPNPFRAGGTAVVCSIVGKGMDPAHKL